jgi:hypothetical protein
LFPFFVQIWAYFIPSLADVADQMAKVREAVANVVVQTAVDRKLSLLLLRADMDHPDVSLHFPCCVHHE